MSPRPMDPSSGDSTLALDLDRIVQTIDRLRRRIEERFPGSSLASVCGTLVEIAERTKRRLDWVARPNLWLRTATGLMAIGAAHCAYDRGISIPGQLSIIGFDDIAFAEVTQPPLTTVAVPRRKIGEVAFQALSEMILATDNRSGREFRLTSHLVIRDSTGPAPGK